MLSKEQAKEALEQDKELSIGTLWAIKSGNGVYVNCYPDCNCSMDTYSSFEEFWDNWGGYFEVSGKIIGE